MDDAVEFFKAYATALTRKHKAAGEKPENDTSFRFETRSGLVHMERKGADVLVFDGATPDMLRHLDTIWRGAKKSELKGFERLKLFVCEKDGVKEAFPGTCPKCGKELIFKDGKESPKKPAKKKREY
jgi:hypothetical protein